MAFVAYSSDELRPHESPASTHFTIQATELLPLRSGIRCRLPVIVRVYRPTGGIAYAVS